MSKSIDVRRGEETKQINLCFLHMVVAVPTFFAEPLVWVERWSSGGKVCFMTKGRFTSMAWFLGCIVLRPLSAGGGRNARLFSERHRSDLVRSGGGFPILANPTI